MEAVQKRLKRVSWAPEAKLRQERFFLSEDAPVISGFGIQDHLQAKVSCLWRSTAFVSDEPPLPVPKVPYASKKHKKDAFQVPLVEWKCPHQMLLNPQWLVVAGEESTEVAVQMQRQLGALEAIYPRLTSIPANPSVSPKAQDSQYVDSDIRLVPLTGIEDEETDPSCLTLTVDPPKSGQASIPENLSRDQTPQLTVTLPLEKIQENISPSIMPKQKFELIDGVEPDIAAAAAAVYTAIMKSNDDGNMIDRELLIELLSNPTTIEKLVSDVGAPKQSLPAVVSPASIPSLPAKICHSGPLPSPPAHFVSWPLPGTAELSTPKHPRESSPSKDLNYHKSSMWSKGHGDTAYLKRLVQQHGGEGRALWERSSNFFVNHSPQVLGPRERRVVSCKRVSTQRDLKPRNPVPCAFFNSPKGCKNGSRCMFLHHTV